MMKERRCNKGHTLIRVLPTLYDTRTKLAREVLSELRAKFRDYLMESTVNFNIELKEAGELRLADDVHHTIWSSRLQVISSTSVAN